MSYKKFSKLFTPGGFEHRTLRRIFDGELSETFDCKTLGLDPSDKSNWDTVADKVEEEYRRWVKIHKAGAAYIDVEREHIEDDQYVLQAFLSRNGNAALTALDRGLVWSREEVAPDLAETSKWYETDLVFDRIERRKAQNLMELANEFPELRRVKGKFVYLRMQGSLENGYWHRPPSLARI